jgi:hypothetical protein
MPDQFAASPILVPHPKYPDQPAPPADLAAVLVSPSHLQGLILWVPNLTKIGTLRELVHSPSHLQ